VAAPDGYLSLTAGHPACTYHLELWLGGRPGPLHSSPVWTCPTGAANRHVIWDYFSEPPGSWYFTYMEVDTSIAPYSQHTALSPFLTLP
jgi:hypothetical protein